jgi:ferredoxin
MPKVRLGRTEIVSEKNAFGALPIQRVDKQEAAKILLCALDGGITYFDTARGYTDSEEKIAYAMSDRRPQFHLATKTKATTADAFWKDLHTRLKRSKQTISTFFSSTTPNSAQSPKTGRGCTKACSRPRRRGKSLYRHDEPPSARRPRSRGVRPVRHAPVPVFLSCRRGRRSACTPVQNVRRGLYLHEGAFRRAHYGLPRAYAYQTQFDNSLPIWGIQRMIELEQFLSCTDNPPVLDDELRAVIAKDRKELSGDFCRGCGYCLPCPANINIPMSARIRFSMTRQPTSRTLNEKTREEMERIENCIECRHCAEHCPYGLDTPAILRESLAFYREFLQSL